MYETPMPTGHQCQRLGDLEPTGEGGHEAHHGDEAEDVESRVHPFILRVWRPPGNQSIN